MLLLLLLQSTVAVWSSALNWTPGRGQEVDECCEARLIANLKSWRASQPPPPPHPTSPSLTSTWPAAAAACIFNMNFTLPACPPADIKEKNKEFIYD